MSGIGTAFRLPLPLHPCWWIGASSPRYRLPFPVPQRASARATKASELPLIPRFKFPRLRDVLNVDRLMSRLVSPEGERDKNRDIRGVFKGHYPLLRGGSCENNHLTLFLCPVLRPVSPLCPAPSPLMSRLNDPLRRDIRAGHKPEKGASGT